MSSPVSIDSNSITKKIIEILPIQIQGTATKVSEFIENNHDFVEASALFYGLFFVTSRAACSAGCVTAIGIIGLSIASDFLDLPKWADRYITPFTDMENVDKAWLLTATAAAFLVTGSALLFEIGLGLAIGISLHTALNARIIQPLFGPASK
ncbi:MAG: hypothetical protein K940chlam3_01351 [Chlamydiae bacterium]|nr:hypothetical protein [Chlamydiota bacterium]